MHNVLIAVSSLALLYSSDTILHYSLPFHLILHYPLPFHSTLLSCSYLDYVSRIILPFPFSPLPHPQSTEPVSTSSQHYPEPSFLSFPFLFPSWLSLCTHSSIARDVNTLLQQTNRHNCNIAR